LVITVRCPCSFDGVLLRKCNSSANLKLSPLLPVVNPLPTCEIMLLLRGIMTNTVQGHTAPSSSPAALQLNFSDLSAALAAAIMAACEPRNAKPPWSLAALQKHRTWDMGEQLLLTLNCSTPKLLYRYMGYW
jgi:hypothetical protein